MVKEWKGWLSSLFSFFGGRVRDGIKIIIFRGRLGDGKGMEGTVRNGKGKVRGRKGRFLILKKI